jgi:hypothetical protein
LEIMMHHPYCSVNRTIQRNEAPRSATQYFPIQV